MLDASLKDSIISTTRRCYYLRMRSESLKDSIISTTRRFGVFRTPAFSLKDSIISTTRRSYSLEDLASRSEGLYNFYYS